MSARAQTGTAPLAISRHDPAVLLALSGAGVLLVEAALAALLFGLDAEAASPTPTALVLVIGAFATLGAARLLPRAPRLASLVCLLAAAAATGAYLPLFVHRLRDLYSGPDFAPVHSTPGEVVTALVAWLLAAAPLACAAWLSWRQSVRARGRVSGEPG